jgi:hypothetical protein
MNEDVIANIRSRIERCKRLASMITDKQAIEVLLEMVEEGERDIERLEAREGGSRQAEGKS